MNMLNKSNKKFSTGDNVFSTIFGHGEINLTYRDGSVSVNFKNTSADFEKDGKWTPSDEHFTLFHYDHPVIKALKIKEERL